uniref:Uncharacterized protein n=1 Tax=Leersia perrieri TaxID=77586 RepID=A0A0D9WI83_9ORYZ
MALLTRSVCVLLVLALFVLASAFIPASALHHHEEDKGDADSGVYSGNTRVDDGGVTVPLEHDDIVGRRLQEEKEHLINEEMRPLFSGWSHFSGGSSRVSGSFSSGGSSRGADGSRGGGGRGGGFGPHVVPRLPPHIPGGNDSGGVRSVGVAAASVLAAAWLLL